MREGGRGTSGNVHNKGDFLYCEATFGRNIIRYYQHGGSVKGTIYMLVSL